MSIVIDKEEVVAAISTNVIRLRNLREWSQEELARRAGLSRLTVNRIENGHSEPMSCALFSIADAFGVPADSLRVVSEKSASSS